MRFLLMLLFSGSIFAQGNCAPTPELAVMQHFSGHTDESNGYRVVSVWHDLVGQGFWAQVRSCSHPEWPPYTMPVPAGLVDVGAQPIRPVDTPVEIAVHAGERVLVYRRSTAGRMQLDGIAGSSGAVGDLIAVSIAIFKNDEGAYRVKAVIQRKGEVELQ